jgi:aryl-alcohol dehydrogenase-like predicted oxidoreductase
VDLGVPVATLALRWALEQTGVTAAIAGSRSADHTRDNALAGEFTLDPSVREQLDALVG